jgi:large-conductance mechanosensitive channel
VALNFLIQLPIEENNMSTTMVFPRTPPLQAASIYTQQATAQQTGGIDISTLMNLMLPAMVIGMMVKMMGSSLGKKKEVTAAETKNANPRAKKATAV